MRETPILIKVALITEKMKTIQVRILAKANLLPEWKYQKLVDSLVDGPIEIRLKKHNPQRIM